MTSSKPNTLTESGLTQTLLKMGACPHVDQNFRKKYFESLILAFATKLNVFSLDL